MAVTYPAPQPTLSGDNITISRFLKDPTQVARRLRTLAEQRFIADALLSGRYSTDSGSVLYEIDEGIYADRPPRAVAPGADYPVTPIQTGTAALAKTVKWGNDALITDESISRQKMSPVEKAFLKLVNQTVKSIDGIALSAIASVVTQNTGAIAPWDGSGATPMIFRDVMRAKAKIVGLNQGYDPDTLVVDDLTFANIISDPQISLMLPRETSDNPIHTGDFPVIGGIRFLCSPNLPVANAAFLLDSTQLGAMVDENLAGPGYAGTVSGIQVKSIRDEENDGWRVRNRRVTVPIIQEPRAAWKITGVAA